MTNIRNEINNLIKQINKEVKDDEPVRFIVTEDYDPAIEYPAGTEIFVPDFGDNNEY